MSPSRETIRPQLGVFDLAMILIGSVIGMGIFRTPSAVAQNALVPAVFFIAWITGALVSLIGALTFAEIGSRYPVAGGFYKIFSHCYHPCFAFMVNWIIVVSNAGATAAAAIMGADYVAPILLPHLPERLSIPLITISCTVLLYIVNIIGIKISARLLNTLMFVKIALLLLLISAIFFVGGSHAVPVAADPEQLPFPTLFRAFTICFIPVFFTYGGYQHTINFGSDIAHARRSLPRAVFYGISVVLLIYLSVNYAYFHVLGLKGLAHSTTIASDITRMMLGPMAYKIVSVIMFLSVMAYVNVSIMSNPRIYFAMAQDGILPPAFKRLNDKTQVQEFALTVFCVFIVLTLFFISSFEKLLNYVMFFDSISLISAAACIFVLRYRAKKNGEPAGVYKLTGYPFLPILFIVVYGMVNISVLLAKPEAAITGLLLFISGFPLFYFIKFALRKLKKISEDNLDD
jgi:basic amino acid/polyamine antiporter, APA family